MFLVDNVMFVDRYGHMVSWNTYTIQAWVNKLKESDLVLRHEAWHSTFSLDARELADRVNRFERFSNIALM